VSNRMGEGKKNMFKTISSKNSEIFLPQSGHFIILSLTLFSLVFVFSTYIYSEQVFIALQKRFVVPHLERKFGFRGKQKKILLDGRETQAFVIERIEPGGIFERAGFRPGDAPVYSGCRFFVIGKTSEAMFYSQLNNLGDENWTEFRVQETEVYDDAKKRIPFTYNPQRNVYLTAARHKCPNFR
jgi:hypothetical protein